MWSKLLWVCPKNYTVIIILVFSFFFPTLWLYKSKFNVCCGVDLFILKSNSGHSQPDSFIQVLWSLNFTCSVILCGKSLCVGLWPVELVRSVRAELVSFCPIKELLLPPNVRIFNQWARAAPSQRGQRARIKILDFHPSSHSIFLIHLRTARSPNSPGPTSGCCSQAPDPLLPVWSPTCYARVTRREGKEAEGSREGGRTKLNFKSVHRWI